MFLCLMMASLVLLLVVGLRLLNSFPTRRSSDLLDGRRRDAEVADLHPVDDERDAARADAARVNGMRSEEHTSELQSRFDLVCRLLLEKKNVVMGDGGIQSPIQVSNVPNID